MSPSCPISQRRVDTQIVRAISVLITITALLFLITSNLIFAYLLLIDFSLRLFRKNSYSPFFQLSLAILKLLNIQPKMSDEAPKRFALYIGWGMAVLIVVAMFFNATTFASALVFVLLACSAMEMFFEYCVGCTVYQQLKKFRIL